MCVLLGPLHRAYEPHGQGLPCPATRSVVEGSSRPLGKTPWRCTGSFHALARPPHSLHFFLQLYDVQHCMTVEAPEHIHAPTNLPLVAAAAGAPALSARGLCCAK
eukprot:scaffold77744_cov13-Tisochrysis_lutea.AAC.1